MTEPPTLPSTWTPIAWRPRHDDGSNLLTWTMFLDAPIDVETARRPPPDGEQAHGRARRVGGATGAIGDLTSTDLPTRGRQGKAMANTVFDFVVEHPAGSRIRICIRHGSLSVNATGDRLISDDLAADVEVDRCIDALKAELEALSAPAKATLLKS